MTPSREYDLRAAARRIRETTHPHAENLAENNVLNPRSEADVLEAFQAASVG